MAEEEKSVRILYMEDDDGFAGKRAGLQISSKLLSLARIVHDSP